jgi:hypothetical protein
MGQPLTDSVLTKKDLMEKWNEIVTDQTLKIDDMRAFVAAQNQIALCFMAVYCFHHLGSTGLKGCLHSIGRGFGLASPDTCRWAKTKVIGLFIGPKYQQ